MSEANQKRPLAPTGRQKKLRTMLSDTAYVAFGSYSSSFFSFFINLILIRKLTLENFGVYSIMLSTYVMGALALSLGIQPIIERYLPELLAKGNRRGVIRLQGIGAATHFGAGLLLALLCWLFRDQLAVWLQVPQFAGLLPFFVLFLIFKFEAATFQDMLTAHKRHKYRSLILAAFQALKCGLFLFALPNDGSVQTVLFYMLISNLFLMLSFGGRIFFVSRPLPDKTSEPLQARRMIRYGLLRYSTMIMVLGLFTDVDVWIIAHFLGPEQAGLYGFATKTVLMLANMIPTSFMMTVILPVAIEEYTRNRDPDQLIRVYRFYNKAVTVFLAPTLVGSIMLTTPIVAEIFDPKYLPSVPAFRVFFVGMFVFWFLNTCSFLLTVLERPEITLYSRVFIIYNLGLEWYLVPRIGIIGAAIATGSAMAFAYIFTYLMVKRIIRVRIPWMATFRTFLYCGVMALAVWPLLGWIDSVPKLIATVSLGVVVYGVLAWRLPVFNTEERQRLNAAFGKRVFPV